MGGSGNVVSWFAFKVGGRSPVDLVFDCAVKVHNYVFAARQMHVARDCAWLGLQVANYGSNDLRVGHNGNLSALRRDDKNNFLAWLEF